MVGLARREERFTERQIAILRAHHGKILAGHRTFEHFPRDSSVLSRAYVQMERENGPKFKQDKLAKALLVCFIDRCTNLPVRQRRTVFSKHEAALSFQCSRKTRREPNPFCRIQVDSTEQKTATLESQTNPKFEHISQILCANPLQQKLTIHVCDSRSNNEDIAFFELPLKQIFDIDTMTIGTQSYSLRSTSQALNGASIDVRLSLFVSYCSGIRWRTSRSSPNERSCLRAAATRDV